MLARVRSAPVFGVKAGRRLRGGRRRARLALLHHRRSSRFRGTRESGPRPRGHPQRRARVPHRSITVNLAPAEVRKVGTAFRRAHGPGILVATETLKPERLEPRGCARRVVSRRTHSACARRLAHHTPLPAARRPSPPRPRRQRRGGGGSGRGRRNSSRHAPRGARVPERGAARSPHSGRDRWAAPRTRTRVWISQTCAARSGRNAPSRSRRLEVTTGWDSVQ
jgi:hypothetical protein